MDSCNSDFLKETEYSENDDIKRIKQMLTSGDKEHIIRASSEILSGMEDNKRMVDMIKSDVCVFLCNAMTPFESNISGTIYNCLAAMAKSKYFYSHGHASVAIETVTRSMIFFIKSGSHDFSLRQPLQLLELIIDGYSEFHVQPEKSPLKNLMTLIFSLLNETVTPGINYQIGVIIRGIFDMDFLINPKWLVSISEKWLDACFFKNAEPFTLTEDFINLGCSISKQALSCLIDNNSIGPEIDLETKSDCDIAKAITIFLLEYASPYIVLEGDEVEKEGFERLEHYFMCLSLLLKNMLEQQQQQFIINKLSEMGLIQFIYSILSDKFLNRCENLCKHCLEVLLEILLSLSDDVFGFNSMWPDGRDNFRNEITKGMYLLPVDASLWGDSITDVALSRSGKLFSVIFFYFHFLTIKSTSNEIRVKHPPAVNLVNTMLEKTSPPLGIKVVWFIFVMTQMSETSTRDSLTMEKMVGILEAQTELTLLYTHHPAMLYWTFSSPVISFKIQCEMVKLWFQNSSGDSSILDNLVEKLEDVRLVLFELLQNGDEHTTRMAFSTLKAFMLSSEDDSQTGRVWFLLLHTLARFTTDSSNVSAVEVDYIMELATLRAPGQQNLTESVRIASLLPEALKKTDLISLTFAMKLILQLLETSLKCDDSRVLSAFLRSGALTQRVLSALETNISELLLYSLKITAVLWKKPPRSMLLLPDYDGLMLDSSVLLKIINSKDMEIINAGLVLIEQMLSDRFKSYLITVRLSPYFMETLFFGLENALMTHLPLISGRAWSCLSHCINENDKFAEDVLLNEVIKYGLEHVDETPEIVDFLLIWMERKNENEIFNTCYRRIKQSYFFETIHYIATFLAGCPPGNVWRLRDGVLKCCRHFSIDTSTEPFKRIISPPSDITNVIAEEKELLTEETKSLYEASFE